MGMAGFGGPGALYWSNAEEAGLLPGVGGGCEWSGIICPWLMSLSAPDDIKHAEKITSRGSKVNFLNQ